MIQTFKYALFVQHYVKHALPIAQIAFHVTQFNLELFLVLHAYAKQDIIKLRAIFVKNHVIFHV
jgi:hypothetical protein